MSPVEHAPVAVTGIGLVTRGSLGGREASAARRRELIEGGTALPEDGGSYPLEDFEAASLLGRRGLRHLTRGTLFLLAAAGLALRDAGLAGEEESAGGGIGVAVGTMTGNADLVVNFDRTILEEGPQGVNPALFPQTVWNSSSSQVAIRFGLEGLNTTLSTGLNSGHDALLDACRTLRGGRERIMLAGGFEELTPSFEPLLPVRAGSAGRWPGSEGAAVLVLESEKTASARGAVSLALLRGGRSAFCPRSSGGAEDFAVFRESLLKATLEEDRCEASRIRRIWALCYSPPPEGWEKGAFAGVFPEGLPEVLHLPALAGCSGGLTGALAAALASAPDGDGSTAGERDCELIVSEDGLGRLAALLVERV